MLAAIRRYGADGAAFALILIVLTVSAGWVFDIPVLKSLVPGRVAMKLSTCLVFALLSATILILTHRGGEPSGRMAALALSATIIALAGLVLAAYATGVEFRFEAWIAGEGPGALETIHPGRMAPNTAASFLALVAALWCLQSASKKVQHLASLLLYTVVFSSFLVILGYLYGVLNLREFGRFTPMSLPAAVSFIVASAAIALTCTDRGFCSLILDEGIAGSVARRLLPAAVLVPVTAGWFRLAGERAHLYDTAFGVALMVVIYILGIGTLIWFTALMLRRIDRQRSAAEQQLRELTLTDPLTGLYNRRGFTQLASAGLQLARRNGLRAAMVYLDVDAFKAINDRFGHREGDAALQVIAAILRNTCRTVDTIGRIGGDEFCIFTVSPSGDGADIVKRVGDAVRSENASRRHPYALSLSAGWATAEPTEPLTVDRLLKRADRDMFRARGRTVLVGQRSEASGVHGADRIPLLSEEPPGSSSRIGHRADRLRPARPLEGSLPGVGVVSILDISSTGARIWSSHAVDSQRRWTSLQIHDPATGIDASLNCTIVWQRRDSRLGHDIGLAWGPEAEAPEILSSICSLRRTNGSTQPRASDRFRLTSALPATLTQQGDVAIYDVSPEGIRIGSPSPLAVGTSGTISVGSSLGPSVTVTVVWCKPAASATSSPSFESGLRVMGGEMSVEWLIAAVVASRRHEHAASVA